jgi:hypothetical protein
MKKLLPFFMAVLLSLPVLAQKSARESQQAKQHQRLVNVEVPWGNIHFPATALRNQPFQFTMQRTSHEKNMRAIMQQLDSHVYQEYDASTSSWINGSLNEYAYDGSGYNTSDIFSMWNPGTELFEIVGKEEYTFANGNLLETIYFEWNAGGNMYVQLYKRTYDYNGDGYMTIAYHYLWDGSVWEVASKFEYTYDTDGNMAQQILTWWDSFNNVWINSSKLENLYNGSGALIVSTTFYWDMSSGSWQNGFRDEYAYNGSGQMISSIHMSWNSGSSQWENSYKYEYTYDDYMNMVMTLEFEWDGTQWVNSYKSELAYNNAYTSNELILPWMFLGDSEILMHMITGITNYVYSGQTFVMMGRRVFNYSEVNLTTVAEHETPQARIYPQPANDRITFSWDTHQPTLELSIYDLNGKEALSQQLDNHGSVSVNQLKPGLYFYRLAGNNQKVHTGKISVR